VVASHARGLASRFTVTDPAHDRARQTARRWGLHRRCPATRSRSPSSPSATGRRFCLDDKGSPSTAAESLTLLGHLAPPVRRSRFQSSRRTSSSCGRPADEVKGRVQSSDHP
jgi:hypothetical protein